MSFNNPQENSGGGANEPSALPVPIAEGGTAADDAAEARDNLGLEIGADVQGYDADLTEVADVTIGTQKVLGRAGGDVAALDIDADLSAVSASDDSLPSAKAVKNVTALPSLGTISTSLTGVLRADAGVIAVDSDVTDLVAAASDSAAGKVELATAAETTTGTDAARAVTPDGLAGSDIFGRKVVSIQVFDGATDVATGDGKAYITIPAALNGMNLVRAQATVVTAGTTNATTVMVHNKTDAADMLSGAISIASAGTVGTVGTVNTSADDVATNDVLRIDVDSVSTTAPKGLMVVLEFQLP